MTQLRKKHKTPWEKAFLKIFFLYYKELLQLNTKETQIAQFLKNGQVT